jgi:predicted RNA-binding protein with RPS1 domain
LNVGDEVDAKIIALDPEAKKMNLSIKALLDAPERKPRNNREESDEERPARRSRAPKKDDDEMNAWNEGSISGTSIADLIEAQKNK